jgi:hypothetical protein
MAEDSNRSEKHELARNTLPLELQPVFDLFVQDYQFAARIHHGHPFVSYIVLADMVKAGWRLSSESNRSLEEAKWRERVDGHSCRE